MIATMGEMVVNGVSTRKVTNVFEKLCGTKISKSAVSEACKELSTSVDKFKNRPIEKTILSSQLTQRISKSAKNSALSPRP